jgi:hypothetical protein
VDVGLLGVDGGTLTVSTGGVLTDSGTATVSSGGSVTVGSGSTLAVESGSTPTVDSGRTVVLAGGTLTVGPGETVTIGPGAPVPRPDGLADLRGGSSLARNSGLAGLSGLPETRERNLSQMSRTHSITLWTNWIAPYGMPRMMCGAFSLTRLTLLCPRPI